MRFRTIAPVAFAALIGLVIGLLAQQIPLSVKGPTPPAHATPKPSVSVRIFIVRALTRPTGGAGNYTFQLGAFSMSQGPYTCAAGTGTLKINNGKVTYDIKKPLKANKGNFDVEATLFSGVPTGDDKYLYTDYYLDFESTSTASSNAFTGRSVSESPAYDIANSGTIVEACD